ncbi:flagellin [Bacillus sp. JJ1566]|uniref:flagellin N-terminal helical domain-containing protein n=1 Tax=Bacillus sp. JJ1566 TaxID=3122961 RepID=UPI002FFE6774
MIINHNLNAMNSHRQMGMNVNAGAKAMEKLSSGLRINRAADDAAGLSISEKMRSQIRGLDQASRNAQDGISLIQTAEGAMNEVSSMLVRMKELAVQKSTGTYNTADKANIDAEMDALKAEITNIQTSTKFNDSTVLNGGTRDIAINHDGTVKLTVADGDISAAVALTNASTGADIDAAIDAVNTSRSALGALQNRLESTVRNVDTTKENLQAAESRIRDTDMAKEMMEFTRTNILNQASQAMLAQANQQPQAVLQLLR